MKPNKYHQLLTFNIKFLLLFACAFAFANQPNEQSTSKQDLLIKGGSPLPNSQISKPETLNSNSNSKQGDDPMESAPTVTSVHHQVWTSSSGSLNELSPEIISKLRGDVPFLAAYALRPRLVGSSLTAAAAAAAPVVNGNKGEQKSDLVAQQSNGNARVRSANQRAEENLIPKLGDFSELKIETSSLSKSEHHHNRKTSLKRNGNGEFGASRASNLKRGNKLSRRDRRNNNKLHSKRSGSLINKRIRAKKVNPKAEEFLKNPQLGRSEKLQKGKDSKESADGGKISPREKKRPFYSKNDKAADDDDSSKSTDENDLDEQPKRVGDADIDEDGDTVTVMPKSDGVDDDPEVDEGGPVEDNDASPGDNADDGSQDDPAERENDAKPGLDEGSGKRVGREKPNGDGGGVTTAFGGGLGAATGAAGAGGGDGSPDSDEREGDSDDSMDGLPEDRNSGAGSGSKSSGGSSVEFSDQDVERTNSRGHPEPNFDTPKRGRDFDAADKGDDSKEETDYGRKSERKDAHDEDDNREPDVDYRDEGETLENGEKRKMKKHGSKDGCEDGSYNHQHDHHHHHHHGDSIKWLQDAIPGQPKVDYPTLNRVNGTNFNCREQKYPGFYADVESRCQVFHICQKDGRQDSFLCPNGTIFSQISTVCVWWNSFDCEDSPKYYELNALLYKHRTSSSSSSSSSSGQANGVNPKSLDDDGDEYNDEKKNLAPIRPREGTLTNSVDYNDSDDSSGSMDELIKSMRRTSYRDGNDATDSLDNEADAEKRIKSNGSDKRRVSKGNDVADKSIIDDDDEATIQRKQTDYSDEDGLGDGDGDAAANRSSSNRSDGSSSSRLRAKSHRRERRASAKRAPPKLKSRRASRYSRRRKLRHGVKPKRRA